jgi:hypothetical protein
MTGLAPDNGFGTQTDETDKRKYSSRYDLGNCTPYFNEPEKVVERRHQMHLLSNRRSF